MQNINKRLHVLVLKFLNSLDYLFVKLKLILQCIKQILIVPGFEPNQKSRTRLHKYSAQPLDKSR